MAGLAVSLGGRGRPVADQARERQPDGRADPVAMHVTRDWVSLYAERTASLGALRAKWARAQAAAVLAPGVVRFGRAQQRRAARPKRAVVATAFATTAMLTGGGAVLADSTVHQVQPGDTLSGLADQYGTTVDALT